MRLNEDVKEDLEYIYNIVIKYLLISLLCIGALSIIIAPPIILMFFSEGFLSGIGCSILIAEVITGFIITYYFENNIDWSE